MTESIRDLLARPPGGEPLTVRGWIKTARDSKNVMFLELSDGSCLRGLQGVIDKTSGDFPLDRLSTGTAVEVRGRLCPSAGAKQEVELAVQSLTVLGDCPPDFPLQKKRHSFEYLREIAHLRPRTNTFGAVCRVRSRLSYAIHRFFQDRGFFYIHTPIISASDCEGAGQMFSVTALDLSSPPRTPEGGVDYGEDFFGKPARLTVSGQLEAETLALALKNVYTFGPTFRAEKSSTTRHLAEFWMVEPEMAFCDIALNQEIAGEFIRFLIRDLLENCPDDMEFFDRWVEKGIIESLSKTAAQEFIRLTYTQAVEELKKARRDFVYPVSWGIDLQSEHEKYLTDEVFRSPVILTDYPRDIKAFYMKQNDDGRTVRAMDVLVPRLGEIIGGSQREEDYGRLKARMEELKMDGGDYGWYLELRRFGSVPHSGFGLGLERLVQYVTGMINIRDVIPFPRCYKSAEF